MDGYHARCVELLSPLVSDEVRDWLMQVCAPL
jgi:hypothetical protein